MIRRDVLDRVRKFPITRILESYHDPDNGRDLKPKKVTKSGLRYYICPFHGHFAKRKESYDEIIPLLPERTASFVVRPNSNFYKCFGCHVSGDVITLVREMESVPFWRAVEIIARKMGLRMRDIHEPKATTRQLRRLEIGRGLY